MNKLDTATTEDRLIALPTRLLGRKAEDLGPDEYLVKDMVLDSVDLPGLCPGIEEAFEIVFPAAGQKVSNVRTIRELVALVEEYQP